MSRSSDFASKPHSLKNLRSALFGISVKKEDDGQPVTPDPKDIPESEFRAAVARLREANTPDRREKERVQIEDYLRKRYPDIYGVVVTPKRVVFNETVRTGPGTPYFVVPPLDAESH